MTLATLVSIKEIKLFISSQCHTVKLYSLAVQHTDFALKCMVVQTYSTVLWARKKSWWDSNFMKGSLKIHFVTGLWKNPNFISFTVRTSISLKDFGKSADYIKISRGGGGISSKYRRKTNFMKGLQMSYVSWK